MFPVKLAIRSLSISSYLTWWEREVVQLVELQAGRSWVRSPLLSLEFLIDIILPAALW